jgi:ATP-dependent helicase HrpB
MKELKRAQNKIDEKILSILLLFAYPDRLAKQRGKNDNRYKLSNSKGAVINSEDSLFNEKFLITPILNAQNKDSYIHLALKISQDAIEQNFKEYLQIKQTINYNKETKKFDIREVCNFYEVELSSKPISQNIKIDFPKLICDLIKKEGLELLTWSKKALELKNRVNFINKHIKDQFPSFEENELKNSVNLWLKPYLSDIKAIKQLESLDIYTILFSSIPWEKQSLLDSLAPSYIKVPSGSNIKVDYTNPQTPILAVKIQEVFGMHDTPKVLNGKIALQVHLLSPALRPIQITYDLKSFWENSYDEVKKELFSKYKKHYWPDNPYEAIATNKTKKNMKS